MSFKESLARVVANIKREKDDTVVDKNVPETETPAIDIGE